MFTCFCFVNMKWMNCTFWFFSLRTREASWLSWPLIFCHPCQPVFFRLLWCYFSPQHFLTLSLPVGRHNSSLPVGGHYKKKNAFGTRNCRNTRNKRGYCILMRDQIRGRRGFTRDGKRLVLYVGHSRPLFVADPIPPWLLGRGCLEGDKCIICETSEPFKRKSNLFLHQLGQIDFL